MGCLNFYRMRAGIIHRVLELIGGIKNERVQKLQIGHRIHHIVNVKHWHVKPGFIL